MMTNLNQTFLSKRIAREIKLVRYIPEHRVYELEVMWESQEGVTTRYLPEIHMSPFSIQTFIEKQVVKVPEDEHDCPQKQEPIPPSFESIVLDKTELPSIAEQNTETGTNPSQKHKMLDYDQIVATRGNQPLLQELNELVVKKKPGKESLRKKRK